MRREVPRCGLYVSSSALRCGHTRLYRCAVPNQPATRKHGVRVPDELWSAAMKKAHDRGETLTAVIIRALTRYVRDYEPD